MQKGASGDDEEQKRATHPLLGLARSAVQDERAIVALRLYSSPPALSMTTNTGEPSAAALSVAVGLEEREAQIVAMLSLILWNHCGYADTSRRNQKAFWREKLFVVTPRHVQRYSPPLQSIAAAPQLYDAGVCARACSRMAVRRALEKAGFDLGAVFVDTVEKMQGQVTDLPLPRAPVVVWC
jgi:hypothetical protein